MTEDEAKTKACCGSGYRPMENGSCIGSSCMAWRWSEPALAGQYAEAQADAFRGRMGFCGLAGAPQ